MGSGSRSEKIVSDPQHCLPGQLVEQQLSGEQLGSRQQLVEQLGRQLAAEARAIVEDVLELRQLYANLRRFFAADSSVHRGKRDADARPAEFLCHNVSSRGGGSKAGTVNVHQLRCSKVFF
jgi:hypothetical protein